MPTRARDGSGILLENEEGSKHASNRLNEPKDTADSPVTGGGAKRSHRAGAMIKGMKETSDVVARVKRFAMKYRGLMTNIEHQ